MIDIPIIVVTVPHDTEGENETKYGWSSKGYNNFKFRFKSKLISNCYWLSKLKVSKGLARGRGYNYTAKDIKWFPRES